MSAVRPSKVRGEAPWISPVSVIVSVAALPKVVLPLTVRSPEAVNVPAEVMVPEPVVAMVPVVEIVILLAKSPPAIVPSRISVEVTPPVFMLTAPEVTEKFPEENEAIPLAAVVASSIVIVVPDPLVLEIVNTPVNPSREATPPEAQEPNVGVLPPSKHWLDVPAVA